MNFNMNGYNDSASDNAMFRQNSAVVQSFMTKVYGWMAAALILTGLTAYYVAHTPAIYTKIFSNTAIVIALIVAQLGLVIVISAMINRLSPSLAMILFIMYSILTGVTLSSIFLVYARESIAYVFFITAGMFAVTSLFGMFTKRDLTSLGRFMFMGLIGILIASIVNIFLKNPTVYWVVSYLGVFIFAGLTAADTQKLRNLAYQLEGAGEVALKMSILGALTLYLDFINMFLFLLRIFGNSRN